MAAKNILPVPRPVLDYHGATLSPLLQQWQDRKTVPPVLLIAGPSGVGKRAMAHFLTQWLLCERSVFAKKQETGGDLFGGGLFGDEPAAATTTEAQSEPCGTCTRCQRAISGNWIDFTEISSDSNEDSSRAIKIEQFRQLKATQGFGAFEGSFRVTLIRDAERMTVQAANSLLKILEEPPPGWIFFLTVSDTSLLLPTLVSRCQSIRLRPFSAETLRAILSASDVSTERQTICSQLALGSWTRALDLASDAVWERRAQVFRFIEKPQTELNALVDWAAQEPANLEILLDQLESAVSDLIQWSLSPSQDAWVNSDYKKVLLQHAQNLSRALGGSPSKARSVWLERSERLFRAREEALTPVNRKLLVQDVLIPWL